MPLWHECQIADVGLKCNDDDYNNNTYSINYYYVSHDILSEYVRACQPQHDSWSKFVHDSDHYGDVSIEWQSVMSSGDFQTTQQYTWENVTLFVVVEDCETIMTTHDTSGMARAL